MFTSWEVLRIKGGFSKDDFELFQHAIMDLMRDPINSAGLEIWIYPPQFSQKWENWLDLFIASGVARKWWGPGTRRKWKFPEEEMEVRMFVAEAAHCAGAYVNFEKYKMKMLTLGLSANSIQMSAQPLLEPQNYEHRKIFHEMSYLRSVLNIDGPPDYGSLSSEEDDEIWTPPKSEFTNEQMEGFMLETTRDGVTEAVLIPGMEINELNDLLLWLRVKHGLTMEQRIQEIRITTELHAFMIDLEESWNWRRVWGAVVAHCGKTRIGFSISTCRGCRCRESRG